MTIQRFFAEHWEKKPLLVKRKERKVGDGNRLTKDLFSFATFERLFSSNRPLFYTKNLNVCRYEDGEKKMLNPEGSPASLKEVRKFWREGSTFQFFQPQQHSEVLHRMIAGLEQYFGALVGANIYMTPPNAQGLAPHYDDVEVFILQLEGKKKWKLYSPPPSDELPREYSRDLDQDECGEPLMELELEEGDLLYFPRGTIHQACTGPSASTHVTISTYQRHTWGDFLAVALPLAIKEAIEEDVEFRRGLPGEASQGKGKGKKASSGSKGQAAKQQQFESKMVSLLHRLSGHLLLHKAADITSLDFVNHRLPPASLCYAAPQEEAQTKKATKKKQSKEPQVQEAQVLDDDSSIRLAEPNYIRLVVATAEDEEGPDAEQAGMLLDEEAGSEEDSEADEDQPKKANGRCKQKVDVEEEESEEGEGADDEDEEDEDEGSVLLYHSLRNPAELHMSGHRNEPSLLRFPLNHLPALKHLVASYPSFVPVASLPGLDPTQAMHLAIALGVEDLLQTSNK
ncbi:cupin superfamily subfamily protein [Acanthamoeba castellanii str. Neff]|uniref:Bifunctional lysine-specific demethylase and histidyl-hydroxylase n=1 Tax=Acanthamoeba castellanii (strain ATCC 30010 / Neff) TaxID=1257118 RepID=L8GZJ3_ACACF|nr:cupin superfamily subfamily protein [Acanthamoeba castellanii str. Neff]ELR18649.1 cupin superfamily subfamily protein [Acanthamoeba castellanii str. Neff]